MIDAYTHLDLTVADPIADFQSRMGSAGVDRALVVEMWNGSNFNCLDQIVNGSYPQFRIVPCFRPAEELPPESLLNNCAVVGLRAKTADLPRLGKRGRWLESSGKWLVAHAESGIGSLVEGLRALRESHPKVRIYVPHLGWPRRDGEDDRDWQDAINALARMPDVVLGISAIKYFSREPFPHHDVACFASRVLSLVSPEYIVAGSDYPLFEKDKYADYMGLAINWIQRSTRKRYPISESAIFQVSNGS